MALSGKAMMATAGFLLFCLSLVSGQNLFGVAYSPYRQYGKCPSKAEIEQDKNIAIQHTTRIRLYSTECHLLNDVVLQLSTTYRTGILMGVWIDNDPTRNQKEIEDLYKYLRKYPNANLLGITVGNEVLHRNTLSPEAVAGLVVQVKQGVRQIGGEVGSSILQSVPVFSVDVIPHPVVVGVSDAVGVNVHPFYRTDIPSNSDPVQMSDLALKSSQEQIATFKRLYGGKEVFVTETGWPSSSAPYEHHRGSLEVQQLYLQKFTGWADGTGLKYFWFELVDSSWKQSQFPYEPMTMSEFHWGIYTAQRGHK